MTANQFADVVIESLSKSPQKWNLCGNYIRCGELEIHVPTMEVSGVGKIGNCLQRRRIRKILQDSIRSWAATKIREAK
jgi:hypothetical protein